MNKLRKSKRKSLKKRRIKGSGSSSSRVAVEPVRAEEVLYLKIEWHMNIMNNYVIYDSYREEDNYLSIELATAEDWLAHNLEPIPGTEIVPLPTNIMEIQVNNEINMLTLRIEDEVRARLSFSRFRTAEELRLKRERYKYMAIKHYVTGMLDAEVSHIEPVRLQVARRINNNTVVPEPQAQEIIQTVSENPNTLYWGGKKSRKRKIKKTKRSKKSKTKKNKL